MSKEVRIGIFAILILLVSIWGYTFLMGKNLLNKTFTYKTKMTDVAQLDMSSPVLINGFKVGKVINIDINPDNLKEMLVEFTIDKDYHIPTDAVATTVQMSLVGGKGVSLEFNHLCKNDCAKSGDTFGSRQMGMIESMVGGDVNEYINNISGQVSKIIEEVGAEDGKGAVNETVRELRNTVKEFAKISKNTNRLIVNNQKSLNETLNSVAAITQNLANNNAQITALLSNTTQITKDLKEANLGQSLKTTLSSTNKSMETTVAQLNATMTKVDGMLTGLNELVAKANAGDGSLSLLLNDKKLYGNLETTTRNLSLLLQDLRLNPKRYVNVSVFGRKGKKYTYPKDDPAYQAEETKKEQK